MNFTLKELIFAGVFGLILLGAVVYKINIYTSTTTPHPNYTTGLITRSEGINQYIRKDTEKIIHCAGNDLPEYGTSFAFITSTESLGIVGNSPLQKRVIHWVMYKLQGTTLYRYCQPVIIAGDIDSTTIPTHFGRGEPIGYNIKPDSFIVTSNEEKVTVTYTLMDNGSGIDKDFSEVFFLP